LIFQVGENIVRRAQDELVRAGICVIQNVKLTNLERIARLFGAQILPNLASLVSIPTLGLCEKFHNVFYEQQQKNLVYLEGIINCTYLGAVRKLRKHIFAYF
jgi:1-phosphatidylinositol-3-phosphate 5-kinase